jgi:hypothetical protein
VVGATGRALENDLAEFFFETEDGGARVIKGARGGVGAAAALYVGEFGEDVVDRCGTSSGIYFGG